MATKMVVKSHEMEPEMLEFVQSQIAYAIEHYNSEREIATHMKTEFEDTYNGTWHCLVGRHFASYVTHEKGMYVYFYVGQMGVMLFKTP
mmetsp:Transcript_67021/g.131982  ORF Transcript_67021/g.131982 Transcript_67021/m.131982 type:complete len:89 (-) Transcript_67021:42-308(-)